MGLTALLAVCFFVVAVVIVCWAAFWLVSKLALEPPVQKIITIVIVLVGLAALAYRFAGGIIPR